MHSRGHRLVRMVNDSISLRKNHESPTHPENNEDIHPQNQQSSCLQKSEPVPSNLHDNSYDTDSIPDSQYGHDISILDTDEEVLWSNIKKPNIVVEESNADSDSDSSSSTHSDKTTDFFSSDDSVKDPNFQISISSSAGSDSEEDLEPEKMLQKQDFSPKPGPSGIGKQKKFQPASTQLASDVGQIYDIDMQSNSVRGQLDAVDTQPLSVDKQSSNVDNQIDSVDTQPPSTDMQSSYVINQPVSVDAQSPCVEIDLPNKSRKRKANPELWKKNKAKLLRNTGKAYTSLSKSKKLVEEKKMGQACSDKCKLKCSTSFSEVDRQLIFEEYWKTADLHIQRQFVQEHMTKVEPKYRYTRVGSTRKNFNHAYFLPLNKTRIRVCKIMFMHTLAISDKAIRTVQKKHSSLTGTQIKDMRGRHGSHNKTESYLIDGVKSHIQSIPRIESHYCRAQTKREYIEGGSSIATLHRDYVEKCKSEGVQYVSYQIYYNIFMKDFNISFWQPKKDQCEDCTAYANAEDKAPLRQKQEQHLKEKGLARTEKEKDKDNVSNSFIVAVYDLQAVMPCPQGEVSSFYYISKVNVLNFTITELGSKNTTCFVWHEGEGARGVNELGSCVLMYLKSLNDKATEDFDVVFYSDNCCGQQKNKFMLAMYQHAVCEFPKLRSITHKFLIKGHTQNEGDSVHSVIGKNISKALKSSPIYVPDQYITLIKTAKKKGNPYTVKELSHDSFYDLKPLAVGNYTTTDNGDKLKWSDIKVLKVDKCNKNKFFFKISYEDEEFTSVCTLKKRQTKITVATNTLKKLYAQKLKVPEQKKQGILKLIEKNVIPKYYENFYASL